MSDRLVAPDHVESNALEPKLPDPAHDRLLQIDFGYSYSAGTLGQLEYLGTADCVRSKDEAFDHHYPAIVEANDL
ncbi:hypothetical protein [Mesorhizobium sp. Root102]|uniref:hypothetical protein n=1 Tax=Mesorhizobium sp. Root102 TaxID=1736422 RepID=UPI001FCCD3DF|nr:hypothetical protein [Mesorhizobium sp. Root102]